MNTVSVRAMMEGNLPAADALRELAGWNQTPQDWRRFLALEPDGCFVAAHGDAVIGTVTTAIYGPTLAWIGMMLVHPEHRGRGVGTLLMRHALEYLQGRGVQCVKLDATPAGLPLYERLGFISESTLTRCERPANSESGFSRIAIGDTRALADGDWDAVDDIDAAGFGAPRSRLLRSLAQSSRAALVWAKQDRVLGWGLLRPGTNADYLGPVVCTITEGGLALLEELLRAAENRPVIWDVSDLNEVARSAAQRFGFAALRPLTRMRMGSEIIARSPEAQFAIADPALG